MLTEISAKEIISYLVRKKLKNRKNECLIYFDEIIRLADRILELDEVTVRSNISNSSISNFCTYSEGSIIADYENSLLKVYKNERLVFITKQYYPDRKILKLLKQSERIVNEKYHKLLDEKIKLENKLSEILKNSVVCTKCGYCKHYEDIDLKCLFAYPYTSYDDAGTDFYYRCNECDIQRESRLTEKQFMDILKVHHITYEEWIKKYPKNYKHKSY